MTRAQPAPAALDLARPLAEPLAGVRRRPGDWQHAVARSR